MKPVTSKPFALELGVVFSFPRYNFGIGGITGITVHHLRAEYGEASKKAANNAPSKQRKDAG